MFEIKELVLYVTNMCNLRCKHCYVHKEDNVSLDMDDLRWIMDNIRNDKTIVIGGEPFMYPLLDFVFDNFPEVTVSTNGTFCERKHLRMMEKAGAVQISVEGGKMETDLIRGQGVWDKVLSLARVLRDMGKTVYFRCSYHDGNLDGVAEVVSVAEEIGVPVALFPRVDKVPLSVERQRMFYDYVMKHKDVFVAQPNFFQYIGRKGRCGAGDERLSVFYDGRITPCHLDMDNVVGKIGDNVDVIKSNVFAFLEYVKVAPYDCLTCKHVDVCKGGCYVAKTYIGCPLRYNVQYMTAEKIENKKEVSVHAEKLASFIKYQAGVC